MDPAASQTEPAPTLRARKRERTRERIVETGVELFARKGYNETTVADIAEAADIGTRTFFGYFESKDALLFDDGRARIETAIETIAHASPNAQPARVLLNALDAATLLDDDIASPRARLRLALVDTVPAVRARGARAAQEAGHAFAEALVARFPRLDPAVAAAVSAAFVAASSAAIQSVLEHSSANERTDDLIRRIRTVVAEALGVST
jgi:AcrR family transcriptional regulator